MLFREKVQTVVVGMSKAVRLAVWKYCKEVDVVNFKLTKLGNPCVLVKTAAAPTFSLSFVCSSVAAFCGVRMK